MPAVAITDSNNMFGALEFSVAMARAGIQPIHGCEFTVSLPTIDTPARLTLLAQSEAGYRSLVRLNSAFYLDRDAGAGPLDLDIIAEHAEGLICLTGGMDGVLALLVAQRRGPDAHAVATRLAAMFPRRLYVELQRHPESNSTLSEMESACENDILRIAHELDLPLVATNDVHFADRAMFDAHDALLCISDNESIENAQDRRRLTPEHYFKSQQDMIDLFADQPEAIGNTIEIARRCAFRCTTRDPILPKFTDNEVAALRAAAQAGLDKRLRDRPKAAPEADYRSRLAYELDVIERVGFAGYFLIVADFITWAKTEGIPVGPGRGSGASSLVAYALTITDLDPLRFSLLFERFLNPDRVSMPDFDIDFCQDRRDEVIRYVRKKYGKERVAQIITFGALLSRMAVRDVGRVMRLPYRKVDGLAKLIPRHAARHATIAQALDEEPRLREEVDGDAEVGRLFDYAGALEGLLRNASTHAAGLVIGDRPLDEIVPLYKDARSELPATQFSMKWVEQAGLVKFDFLGLKTLTIIKGAVDLLADGGTVVDIDAIALDDEKTFDIYTSASTVGVFQLESTGMKDTLRMMKPTCIEDIVALVALYRPGPMVNIPDYCRIKNGEQPLQSQHASIDPILAETHGIIVYQEQVMQIAQAMAGYTLAQADILRKAIGKKIKSVMDAEQPQFLAGAAANGISDGKAKEVWDLMARFAEYGFNKSHAAAYAMVSYQTAWLKANHPTEFLAAAMNCDAGDTAKLEAYMSEARRLNIDIVPPDINRSQARFTVSDGRIMYSLCAIKGVGADAMRRLVDLRGEAPFTDLFDLADRVELRLMGKRCLEMVTRAGAFDSLDKNRCRVLASIDVLMAYSATLHAERASQRVSLFGDAENSLPPPRLPDAPQWSDGDKLAQEFEALGYYLSGHPLDHYGEALRRRQAWSFSELRQKSTDGTSRWTAGTVVAKQERLSRNKNRFAFVELSDRTEKMEFTVFGDELAAASSPMAPGDSILFIAEAREENDQLRFRASSIQPITSPPSVSGLRVYFDDPNIPRQVRSILDREAGTDRRRIEFLPVGKDIPVGTTLQVPGDFPVSPDMHKALASLKGVVKTEEV